MEKPKKESSDVPDFVEIDRDTILDITKVVQVRRGYSNSYPCVIFDGVHHALNVIEFQTSELSEAYYKRVKLLFKSRPLPTN
jgi:hypothetical protein